MVNEIYSESQLKSANQPSNNKARKFRWSSCFSFMTKFKKSKSTNDKKVRLSQSYQDFEQQKEPIITSTHTSLSESVKEKPQWKPQPIPPSLSPPPRHSKSKRESMKSQEPLNQHTQKQANNNRNRRPLLDPTLTPRVTIVKTKKQPSLLRLSLDAELIHNNDKEDTSAHSSMSLTPTMVLEAPFRSGTLGANNSPRLSEPLPPLPTYIPHDTSFIDNSSLADSPISISAIKPEEEDQEDKLSLMERRRRRSPLSIPNSDKLTLFTDGEQPDMKRQTYDLHNIYMNHVVDDTIDERAWRASSREEAMLILEGKKKKCDEGSSSKSKKLDRIAENKVAAAYSTRSVPETPPYHQHTAPSLISSPSTPNSIDSSVLDFP